MKLLEKLTSLLFGSKPSAVDSDKEDDFDPENPFPEPITIEITDVFDLHTIQPREVKAVVQEYLHQARVEGFQSVRIIHGKGIGNLRRTVHSILSRHPNVESYSLASEHFGGWGATIIHLRPESVDPA